MLGDHVYRLTDVGRDRAHPGIARVCLRRPGAGAARRLRELGRRPDDFVGAAAEAAARKGVLRHPRRAGDAQPARAGDQLRQGHVPLRPAGQRQDDDRPADHAVLRPEDLDSARDRRRRPDHQAVRRGVPQGRSHRRRESLFRTAEYDRRWISIAGRPWSSAAS